MTSPAVYSCGLVPVVSKTDNIIWFQGQSKKPAWIIYFSLWYKVCKHADSERWLPTVAKLQEKQLDPRKKNWVSSKYMPLLTLYKLM